MPARHAPLSMATIPAGVSVNPCQNASAAIRTSSSAVLTVLPLLASYTPKLQEFNHFPRVTVNSLTVFTESTHSRLQGLRHVLHRGGNSAVSSEPFFLVKRNGDPSGFRSLLDI